MTLLASDNNISNLLLGDCLELLPTIEDNTVNMLLVDLPYGTTANLAGGKYYYDLEIYTGSAVQRLIQGQATVRTNVTT